MLTALTVSYNTAELINMAVYDKCKPIKNHGAPLVDTMHSAHEQGISVISFPVEDYICHAWKGTRRINPKWLEDL